MGKKGRYSGAEYSGKHYFEKPTNLIFTCKVADTCTVIVHNVRVWCKGGHWYFRFEFSKNIIRLINYAKRTKIYQECGELIYLTCFVPSRWSNCLCIVLMWKETIDCNFWSIYFIHMDIIFGYYFKKVLYKW